MQTRRPRSWDAGVSPANLKEPRLNGISKNSFFAKKVGGVSPKRRNGVYAINKFQ
ncbi:MAG: hypothetical protein LBP59_02095 [Planctomycetaceae bacterium]|nr:hypothetical protein [Planctomycetaceae bacterium]